MSDNNGDSTSADVSQSLKNQNLQQCNMTEKSKKLENGSNSDYDSGITYKSNNGSYNTFNDTQKSCDTLTDSQNSEILPESEITPLLQLPKSVKSEDSQNETEKTEHSKFRTRCASGLIIVSLIFSGINIGIHSSILGPALPDLAILTNSTIPEVSILIAGNSAAFILGSVVAGILLEFMDGFFVVSAGFFLQGLVLVVAFRFTDLLTLTSLYGVAQFFATLGMAGISILCFAFPRRQAQILLQIVFMMISVGKTVAPFIVSPFISPDNIATNSTIRTTNHIVGIPEIRMDVINNLQVTHIPEAYLIVAMYSVILSFLNLAIFFVRGEKCIDWTRKTFHKQNKTVEMHTISTKRRLAMLFLMALMMCLESGLEGTETGLLTSYFSEYLHLGKQTGVNAAAFYQGIKIFFSLLVLVILKYIHPATLLFTDLLFILCGSVGMTVAVWFNSSIAVLWVTVAFISAGFSNYLATQVSWLEIRQPIEGKLAPLFSLALGLGGLSLPPITTRFLTAYGPLAYPLIFTCVASIVIILFFITKLVIKESLCPSNKNLYQEYEPEDVLISAHVSSEQTPSTGSMTSKT